MTVFKKPIHPFLIFLAGLALGVLWTAIVYTITTAPEDCKGDGLCEGAQGIVGGIFWGTLMTSVLLPPIVLVATLVFVLVKFVVPRLKNRNLKHPKKKENQADGKR